jgi:tRNA(Ile)-lysidine synthase
MSDALIDRFTAAMSALAPDWKESNTPIGIAVSGGPDSLALLLLAAQAYPGRVIAASVDHGLRTEAGAEAAYVAQLCAARNTPHTILRPAEPIAGNLQSAARTVRYALLDQWASANRCGFLATAHHADDQLETLVMRLLRGSGIDGLSGIRARRRSPGGLTIIRPLLTMTKGELAAVLQEQAIAPVDDPSNRMLAFDRVRLRSALQHLDGFDPRRVAASVAAAEQASAALDWMTAQLASERVSAVDGGVRLHADDLPAELQRRLIAVCLRCIAPDFAPRGGQLARLRDALVARKSQSLGAVMIRVRGQEWLFRLAPPRRGS